MNFVRPGRLFGFADGFHEGAEFGELFAGEGFELAAVELFEGFIDGGEALEAGGGDPGADDAAVVGLAVALEPALALDAVEQAGDVGLAGDHAFADFAAGEAGGAGAAQDAQDIILGGGDVEGPEEIGEGAIELIGGAEDLEEGLLLRGGDGLAQFEFAGEFGGHGGVGPELDISG